MAIRLLFLPCVLQLIGCLNQQPDLLERVLVGDRLVRAGDLPVRRDPLEILKPGPLKVFHLHQQAEYRLRQGAFFYFRQHPPRHAGLVQKVPVADDLLPGGLGHAQHHLIGGEDHPALVLAHGFDREPQQLGPALLGEPRSLSRVIVQISAVGLRGLSLPYAVESVLSAALIVFSHLFMASSRAL